MPRIKNITGTSGAAQERLVVMDEILCGAISPILPDNFLRKINTKLKASIGKDNFNKDIKALRSKLQDYATKNNIKVFLLNERNYGYSYSIPGFKLFEHIDEADKNLLLYATSLFDVFRGTSLHQQFHGVVKRLIDHSITTEIDNFPKNIVQLSNNTQVNGKKWLPEILEAILKKDCIEVHYTNTKKVSTKKQLCPYVVKLYNNRWYMIAYDHTSSRIQKTNVFSLANINSIECSTKAYVLDNHFNAADYFNYSLGIWHEHEQDPIMVKLVFSDKNVFNSIINNPLHHSQKYLLSDSNDTLHVTIEVYDSPELYSLIYSYGAHVKVLAPQSAVDKVRDNMANALALYK
jgi:hypothetical protein